jgi:antitoxin (DNA-binding transcriptional repressor) of toxin-antitoxin stability system
MSEARGSDRTMMASRFKAECLAILDQVERMKISVTITKDGRPPAKVAPLEAAAAVRSLQGSVRLVVEADQAYYSTG